MDVETLVLQAKVRERVAAGCCAEADQGDGVDPFRGLPSVRTVTGRGDFVEPRGGW